MYYAIICEDQKDSLHKRASSRTAHIKRLDELSKQGRILIAAPHPAIDGENPGEAGFIGSLIVAEFDSLTQAESWAKQDPYLDAGVYKQVTVKPFKRVF